MIRIIFIIILLNFQTAAPQQPLWSLYSTRINKELVKLSAGFEKAVFEKAEGGREFYRILSSSGDNTGTLVLTSAQGRFDRFDLMIVTDVSRRIKLIRILKYRSEYGSEITNSSWLTQFYCDPGQRFELHKNIDAISGATFSSRGLGEEVNDVMVKLAQN